MLPGSFRTAAARAAAAASAALVVALAAPRPARAQPVLGAGEDATIPVPGQARARAIPTFTGYGSTFGTGGLRGLGGNFTTDSIGPTQLPGLRSARDTLRAITGNSALALSLGHVQVGAYAQTLITPLLLEVGVARRFAIGLTVPLNRTHITISSAVNTNGATGNFGFNPANAALSGATNATAALLQNGRTQTNLLTVASAVRASGATALADSLMRFAGGLASVYGTGTAAGANAVPLLGSDAQRLVLQQLSHYAASARAAGVTTFDTTAVPAAAQARLSVSQFRRAVADTSFGLAARDSLGDHLRTSVGDIELTAMYQWLNTFDGPADARGSVRSRIAPRGTRVRSTIVAGFRFGTGNAEIPGVLLDVPPATHSNALLLRSITDVVFNARLSVSGAVRVVAPLGDTRTLRIPVSLDSGYVPLFRERPVSRQLGREVQLEFNPRYALNEAFAFWGQALVRDHQGDRYSGQYTATAAEAGVPLSFDASTLGAGTAQRETRAGLGLAYSTVAAWSRGRARVPVEVSYLHAVTAAGAGASQPRLTADVLSLRVYASLRGR